MTKKHGTTKEEVEGPTSSWGLRNRITLLTLQEHDDDDDDDDDNFSRKTEVRNHSLDGDLDWHLIAMWMLKTVGCEIGGRIHNTLDSP